MTDPYATHQESTALLVKDTRTPAEKKLDTMLAQRDTFEQGYEDDATLIRAIAIELIEAQAAERVNVQRMVRDACKSYGKAGECVYTTFMAKYGKVKA